MHSSGCSHGSFCSPILFATAVVACPCLENVRRPRTTVPQPFDISLSLDRPRAFFPHPQKLSFIPRPSSLGLEQSGDYNSRDSLYGLGPRPHLAPWLGFLPFSLPPTPRSVALFTFPSSTQGGSSRRSGPVVIPRLQPPFRHIDARTRHTTRVSAPAPAQGERECDAVFSPVHSLPRVHSRCLSLRACRTYS
jgi:hypothetical protein